MAGGRYINFKSLTKIQDDQSWEEKLWLIVGNEKDTQNYRITDEKLIAILNSKGLISGGSGQAGTIITGNPGKLSKFNLDGNNIEDSIISEINNTSIKIGEYTLELTNGVGNSYTLTFPNKEGTVAMTTDIPSPFVLNDSNLIVSKETDPQNFAEGVDAALLKARGTGVSTSYVSSVVVGSDTFNQGSVSGEINGDQGYFSIIYDAEASTTVTNLASSSTYVYINKEGVLNQQTTQPTRQDFVRKIFTMRISVDTSAGTILGFEYLNNPVGHYSNSMRDLYKFLLLAGVPFKEDQVVTGRTGDLGFDISAGSTLEFGGTGNIYNPNIPPRNAVENAEFFLSTRTAFDAGGNTALPKFWDNNTTLTPLGSTTVVGHRLYRFSNGNIALQYGQGNYANMTLAKAGARLEQYVLNPALKNATFFGWWFIESTATNTGGTTLTDFVEYTIGISGGSSSGLSGCLLRGNNLSDLLNNTSARINFLGSLLDTAAENVLEEKVVSTLIQPTIADGLYTFPTTTGRDFYFEITEDTTLTMPTVEVNTSISFSSDITGNFALILSGFPTTNIQGDTYDGAYINTITFKCYKKANGTQINTAFITNLK